MGWGQGSFPGSKFPSTLGSACAHLFDGFSLSLSSLPPASPSYFSSSPCFFVSDFTSVWIFSFFLFGLSVSFTLYLCLYLFVSPVSLSLCLHFGVSLCVSVSVSLLPASLPISLPYLCLSPQSKKPSLMVLKVSGLYSCPVLCYLPICLSVFWRVRGGGVRQ